MTKRNNAARRDTTLPNCTYIELRKALKTGSPDLTETQLTKHVKGYAKQDIAIYGRMRWFKESGQLEAARKALLDGGCSASQKQFENINAFIDGAPQPHKDAAQFVGQPTSERAPAVGDDVVINVTHKGGVLVFATCASVHALLPYKTITLVVENGQGKVYLDVHREDMRWAAEDKVWLVEYKNCEVQQ